MDWSRVDYFGLWRHPFTSEDPMVSKWCNANFLKVCSNEEKTQHSLGWPEDEQILI